ncbi:M23 family metallopeptidase [Candidatus Parcubacteria bacterium]|nr:M23 family metallopeptidase [Candidatus Parcubacteria bacterium]
MVSIVGAAEARAQGDKFAKLPNIITSQTSQTMPLLEAHLNYNPVASAGGKLAVVDNSALEPLTIDSGDTFADAGQNGGQISTYIVKEGDTLSSIAKLFGVSQNTIVWANNVKGGRITPGQELVILPISGVRHTVVRGDTIATLAKKYNADVGDILSYNGLASDAKLTAGDIIIVPDGEIGSIPSTPAGSKPGVCGIKVSTYERLLVNPCSLPSYPGYFARPLAGGIKSQDLHGYNAIDFAVPQGTPIMAAAAGTVIVSRTGGYNGGYGTYVVISHPNGTQTLYAHMSVNGMTLGQKVTQGQVIGAIGSTGKSTGAHLHIEVRGAHLHIEVRGAKNPF